MRQLKKLIHSGLSNYHFSITMIVLETSKGNLYLPTQEVSNN
jgi:hypothetical protein